MVAPASIACAADLGEERRSERVASSAENSTSSAVLGRRAHARPHALEHLRGLELELAGHVQRARRDEDVDPRAARAGDRPRRRPRCRPARCVRARRRSRRSLPAATALHALEVARRRDREAGLDHVHAEPLELRRDLRLLVRLKRDAGRLLAVAKSGVEDRDPAGWQRSSSSSRPVRGRTGGVVRSACALRGAWSQAPPRGGESRRREGKSGRAQPPRRGCGMGVRARRSSLQVCKCCRAVPGSVKSSAISRSDLDLVGQRSLLCSQWLLAAQPRSLRFSFSVARKPAC